VWWRCASVPRAVAAAQVRSSCFGDYLAGSGDDLDGGVLAAVTGSLGVAVRWTWGLAASL
jgi:hypothetical protein